MTTISRLFLVVLVTTLAPAATNAATYLERFDFDQDSAQQWKLSNQLHEISGLHVTADGYLLAHNDERGAIYVLDFREGRRVKTFRMGQPTVRADFEGVAMAEGYIYMIESLGRLYEAPEGADGERVIYNTYDTGLGRRCEVEGLTPIPERRLLAIACKDPHAPIPIAIYFWSLDDRRILDHRVEIPVAELAAAVNEDRFSPSGMDWDPRTGHFIVIAARQKAIGEISADGRFIDARRLPRKLHRQVEGIAIVPDGPLILADEGGKKRARLTVYVPNS